MITIEVDVSATLNKRGPGIFIKGINNILPYKTKNCKFISSKTIYSFKRKSRANFYFIPYPHFNELIFNKWIEIKKVNKLLALYLLIGAVFLIKKFGTKENFQKS